MGRGTRILRHRRGAAAVAVVTTCAVCAVTLVAASESSEPAVGNAASEFVPADGDVARQERPDGAVLQWEQSIVPGIRGLFVLPQPLIEAVIGGYEDADENATHWVSLGDAAASRDGVVARDVRTVTSDGIRLIGSVGGDVDVGFSPGILVLASDVRDGAAWTSAGRALVAAVSDTGEPSYGAYDYTAHVMARDPRDGRLSDAVEPGCLETVSDVAFTGRSESLIDGGDEFEVSGIDLWCPGRGVVASTGEGGVTLPASPVRALLPPRPSTDGAEAWSDPSGWSATAQDVGWDDPLWEDPAFSVAPSVAPAVIGGRLAVDDPAGDVVVLRAEGDRMVVDRLLHPGGRVLTLSAAAGLLLVSTADRRVVAYDARGVRRWTRLLPDLVYSPIVGSPDGLAVAGVDGVVRLIDPATGDDVWSAPASAAGLERVAVTDAAVLVSDQVGSLAAFALESGELLWEHTADEAYVALAPRGGRLIAATGARVETLDLATGEREAYTDAAASVYDLDVVGDVVLATTASGLLAIDPRDSTTRWRDAGGVREVVTDGQWALVEGDGRLRAVDPRGDELASWPVPPESLGAARFVVRSGGGVQMIDSVTGIVRVSQ